MNLWISTPVNKKTELVLKIVTPSDICFERERKKSQTCINYVIFTLTVEN